MSEEEMEPIEEMGAFFDARVAGYEDHMRWALPDKAFAQLYQAMASPIETTHKPLSILDLGCGTGMEIEEVFQRAPNALITGVDLSEKMLELLQEKHTGHMGQITLVADSYLTMPLGTETYDYIISAMAMHHLLRDPKRELYARIHAALKPGGKYIEGDLVVPLEMENQFRADFDEEVASVPPAEDGYYHIDIPFSIDTQRSLLLEAGFRDFDLIWQREGTEGWNFAVYAVTA